MGIKPDFEVIFIEIKIGGEKEIAFIGTGFDCPEGLNVARPRKGAGVPVGSVRELALVATSVDDPANLDLKRVVGPEVPVCRLIRLKAFQHLLAQRTAGQSPA